ncbi:MAG: sigma-70 family RNA polymerase sigma factor, partial [Nocardioides sp.]
MAEPPPGDSADGSSATGVDLAWCVQRSARGDEAAFADLYDATSARLHGLILRVVRDPAQAEEVTQEVYLEIWRQAARFRPESGSALAWMLTIAHRRAVDRVRSAEASQRRDTAYGDDQAQRPATDVTADTATANLEALHVRRALAALTPAQREAIELSFLSGYTHSEV